MFNVNNAKQDKMSPHCKDCDKLSQEKTKRKTVQKRLDYSREYQAEKRKDFTYRIKMLVNASKQRAKEKGIEHSITVQDVLNEYPIDGICPVLGIKLEFGTAGFRDNSPSIDKIDPKLGYTKDNIQILSWRANRLKVDATIEELELLIAYLKQGAK
jgi:hypothetical protein